MTKEINAQWMDGTFHELKDDIGSVKILIGRNVSKIATDDDLFEMVQEVFKYIADAELRIYQLEAHLSEVCGLKY